MAAEEFSQIASAISKQTNSDKPKKEGSASPGQA
jgi:hypothetical protein